MKSTGAWFTGGLLLLIYKKYCLVVFFSPCASVNFHLLLQILKPDPPQTHFCSSALIPLSDEVKPCNYFVFYWWHLLSFPQDAKPRGTKSNHPSQQNPGNKQLLASLANQVQVTDFGTALCQALSCVYKAFKELSTFFFLFCTFFSTLSVQLSLEAWKCQVVALAVVPLQVQN